MNDFDLMIEEYRLTKAEIFYQESETPHLLQSVVWEDYDVAPDYPELKRFLDELVLHMDGTVQSVRVYDLEKVRPQGLIYAPGSDSVH